MHSLGDYISNHFPELDHPAYQPTAEKLSFVVVSAMLIGALAAGIALLVIEA